MPGNINIRIKGGKVILESMTSLPQYVNRRKEVLDPGLIKGASIIRDQAKTFVPVLSGVLRRNIIIQRWRPEGRSAATVVIRVRKLKGSQIERLKTRNKKRGRSAYKGDPFYWRFIEFGTSAMQARPFLRPAFDTKKEAAVNAAMAEFHNRVQKVVKELGQRSVARMAQDYLNRLGRGR